MIHIESHDRTGDPRLYCSLTLLLEFKRQLPVVQKILMKTTKTSLIHSSSSQETNKHRIRSVRMMISMFTLPHVATILNRDFPGILVSTQCYNELEVVSHFPDTFHEACSSLAL